MTFLRIAPNPKFAQTLLQKRLGSIGLMATLHGR
jgi:hypothetical protein